VCHRGLIRRFRAPARHSALSGLEEKITEQIHWRRNSLSLWAGWLSPDSGTVHLICNLLRGSTPMAARRHGRVSGRRNGRTWLAGLQLILLYYSAQDRSIGETTRVGERGSFVHLQRRSDVPTVSGGMLCLFALHRAIGRCGHRLPHIVSARGCLGKGTGSIRLSDGLPKM
jgi:hypothetical protein